MTENTWGHLDDNEKQAIRESARKFTEDEINEQFVSYDDRVVFRIIRKTNRALAGPLDIDHEQIGKAPVNPIDKVASAIEERILLDRALEDELGEDEIVEGTLISPRDFVYEPEITDEDKKAAKPIDEMMSTFEGYYAQDTAMGREASAIEAEAEAAGLPSVVDDRPNQSPVKDQGARVAAAAFAPVALLEAFEHIPDDLSEECAIYKFKE